MKRTVKQKTFKDRGQVEYDKFILEEKDYNPMYEYN